MAGQSATLRTKTGCLTCRSRRKKCGEERPRCQKCIKSNRTCSWPGKDDLRDRRYTRALRLSASPPSNPGTTSSHEVSLSAINSLSRTRPPASFLCRELSINTDLFNSIKFRSDLEVDSMRHFFLDFLPLLLLSSAHPGFHSAYIPEIVHMLVAFDGLKDVALACGAARLHAATGNEQLHQAGFAYYSRAMSRVNRALSDIDWSHDQYNDAVMTTITFLYMHGVFDMNTYKDIPKHVNGAIQLMNLRCRNSQSSPLARPIHRILWESILYQMFRQTVRHPFVVDFQPDLDFATKAERILGSLTFPDASPADNSPVIGFPLRLQKLIIEIVQLCKTPSRPEDRVLHRLHEEMKQWETSLPEEGCCIDDDSDAGKAVPWKKRTRTFYEHSTSLHILSASLLLDWVSKSTSVSDPENHHLTPTGNSWQMSRALEIMRCSRAKEDWSKCYLGSWPALVFGYAVSSPEDVAVIRQDLQHRYQTIYSGEELSFLVELEEVWQKRGIL